MDDRHALDADGAIEPLLILVLVSAVVIRFWNLASQPWLDIEDVQHIGYARDLVEKGILGHGATYIGWTIIGALTWMVFPGGPYGEMFLSALFGSLSVLLVYRFASACHARMTGLFAATVLAASMIHIHFSRWAQPQAAAIFFVLLAFVLYERAARHAPSTLRRLAAGAAGGFGLLCHLTVVPLPAMLIVAETLSDSAASMVERARRAAVMAAALASPLVAAEVIVRVMRLATGRADIGSPIGHLWLVPNYAAYGGGAIQSIQQQDPLSFWRYLWESEGGWFVIAAIGGWMCLTVALASGPTAAKASAHGRGALLIWLFITGGFIASFGYTLSSGMRLFRYIVPLAPAAALSVAVFLSFTVAAAHDRLSTRSTRRLAAAVCAIVLAAGYVRAHPRVALATGFETVWSSVRESGAKRIAFIGAVESGTGVDTSRWELLTAYMPAETVVLERAQDVNDLRPPPQLVIVGVLSDGSPPEIRGFHASAVVSLRMPNFDARPVQNWDSWGQSQRVFILRE